VFADNDVEWSLSDHLIGAAPGSPNGPAIPGGNANNNQDLRDDRAKRQKVHWAQIIKHVADPDFNIILRTTPGDANAAWLSIEAFYTRPQNELRAIRGDVEVAGAATLNACVSCIRVYHLLRRKPTLDEPN
jgi:hypothetical protein